MWRPGEPSLFAAVYHWFNLFEAGVWAALAAAVLVRFLRNRRSVLEICYAAAFLTFAATDVREAWRLDAWLILLKAVNLLVLLWLRAVVMRRYYPASKLY